MAGSAEGVDSAPVDGRRASRAYAGLELLVPGGDGIGPLQAAGLDAVAGDHFPLVPLLHRDRVSADHGEGRPARADSVPPDQFRGLLHPIACQPDVLDGNVAARPEKLGEIVLGRREIYFCRRVAGGGLGQRLQQPIRLRRETVGEHRRQLAAEPLHTKQNRQDRHTCRTAGQHQQPQPPAMAAEEEEPDCQGRQGQQTQQPRGDVGEGVISEDIAAPHDHPRHAQHDQHGPEPYGRRSASSLSAKGLGRGQWLHGGIAHGSSL